MKDKDKFKEISHLDKKRRKSGLTKVEEKLYCKLNSETTGYPEKFFTKEFQEKLDDLILRSDEIIKKYTKK